MFNSTFFKTTLILLIVAIPLWFIIRRALSRKTHGIDISFWREVLLFIFYMYIIVLIAVTLVPLSYALHRVPSVHDINFVPLKSISYTLQHSSLLRQKFRLAEISGNLVGNIILFIPFGLLLPVVRKKQYSFSRIFFAGLFCSACIESIQYIERSFGVYRSVDIDDVILNTIGAILGWMLLRFFQLFTGNKRIDTA